MNIKATTGGVAEKTSPRNWCLLSSLPTSLHLASKLYVASAACTSGSDRQRASLAWIELKVGAESYSLSWGDRWHPVDISEAYKGVGKP